MNPAPSMPSFAYSISSDGSVERLAAAEKAGPDCVLLWRHIDGNVDDLPSRLTEAAAIPPAALEALQAAETRPRAMKIGDGALVVLRGVNLNPDADPEDLVSIRLWVTAHEIVSTNYRPLLAISDMEEVVREQAVRDAGDFIVELAKVLTGRLDNTLDDLSDCLNLLEVDVIEERGTQLRARIGAVRRTTIELRRFIAPQRDALSQLATGPYGFFDDSDRHYIAEAANGVSRILEEIDSVRDQAAVLSDQLSDIRAEAVGKRTLVLSIVSAVFLPLTFIVGLVGMNVQGIPYASAQWAFAAITAVNLAIGVVVLLYLKAKGWFA